MGQQGECRRLGTLPGDGGRGKAGGLKKVGDTTGGLGEG